MKNKEQIKMRVSICLFLLMFHFSSKAQINYSEPAISPDGKSLIYCSDKLGENAIYRSNQKGKKEKLVVNLPGYESSPNWSPDGKRICFYVMDSTGASDLFIIESDGTGLRNLSRGTFADPMGPSWIDNETIVYAVGKFPVSNIQTMNVGTQEIRDETSLQSLNYCPYFQDSILTFCRLSRSSRGIYFKRESSDTLVRISDSGEAPAISSDCQYIYYQGEVNDVTNIRRVEIETGIDIALTSNESISELPDPDNKNKYLYFQKRINGVFSIWRLNLRTLEQKKIM